MVAKLTTAKQAARMRQPMTRAEVHNLIAATLNPLLNAMNELEERIVALESGERRSASGLLLPASMGSERPQ